MLILAALKKKKICSVLDYGKVNIINSIVAFFPLYFLRVENTESDDASVNGNF